MTKIIKDKLVARGYDVETIEFKALPKPNIKDIANISSYYIKAKRIKSFGNINEFIFKIEYENGNVLWRACEKEVETLYEAIDRIIFLSW